MKTAVADSLGSWAAAFRSMESSDAGAFERVLYPELYDPTKCLDVSEALKELEPSLRGFCRNLLPVIGDNQSVAVLPAAVADVASLQAGLLGSPKYSTKDLRFAKLGQRFGGRNIGWHTDGVSANASPTNLLTVQGVAKASFFRVWDSQRAAQFVGSQSVNTQPSLTEVEAAETISLRPGTLLTFQAFFDPHKPRFQDVHNIETIAQPRNSYRLESFLAQPKALDVFKKLVRLVPGLELYHPEEVQARIDPYL